MSLLNEVRNDLTNESAGLPNTLRKALVLARELQSPELKEWATFELEGYRAADLAPDYRRLNLPVVGKFRDPFRNTTSITISTNGFPESVKVFADTLVFTENVAALEEILSSHQEVFHQTFSPEFTELLRNIVPMTKGTVLLEAYRTIPRYLLAGIADAVKNKLLHFVLELQEKNMMPEINSENTGLNIVHNVTNISGNNNIVASGREVHQSHNVVQKGNIDSLLEYLRSNGVGDDDLRDLKDAVVTDHSAPSGGFGPKVTAWIEMMTAKAVSGAWQASVSDAPIMLVKALQQFCGG